MGGVNGERIHEASYTNVNQFEEIRSLSLVPSKSLSYVVDQLKGVAMGLKDHGYPACQLIYTDSPKGVIGYIPYLISQAQPILAERDFHEEITPSLKLGVEHVTSWTDLPPLEILPNIEQCYTDDLSVMHSICSEILEHSSTSDGTALPVVAIGIHLTIPSEASLSPRIQALQLRTANMNYVFKVCSTHIYS